MFRVINFPTLLRMVAVLITFISIGTYELLRHFWTNELPAIKVLSISPWVASFVILAITTNGIARWLWKGFKKIDSSLFPDLNGTWEGEIETEKGLQIPARAIVRQSLLQMQVDIHTATSKSLTLESTPATESGQCKLYYLYRSMPKTPGWGSYTGSTIFDVRNSEGGLELSGFYFTDRRTRGRIKLRQVNSSVDVDVSYY